MTEKKISVGIGMDDAGAQKILQVLRQINQEAQKLGASLSNMGKGGGMGGLFGGGGISQGGKGSAGRTTATGKVKSDITSGILDNAKAFKDMGKAGKDATEILSASIKRGVSEQKNKIEELDRSIAKITKSYQNWSKAASSVTDANFKKNAGSKLQELEQAGVNAVGQRAKAKNNLSKLEGINPSLMQQTKGAAGQLQGLGMIPGAEYIQQLIKASPLLGAGAAAAYGLGQAGQSFNNYVLNPQAFQASRRAESAQYNFGMRQNLMSGQGSGQLMGLAGMSDAQNEEYQDKNSGWRRALAYGKGLATLNIGVGDMFGEWTQGNFIGRKAQNYVNKDRAAAQADQADLYGAANPVVNNYMASIQANARASLNQQRQIGIYNSAANPQALARLKTKFGGTIDESDIASARTGMLGQTSGFHGLGGWGSVAMGQAAQIGGIADAAGIASKFGGQGEAMANSIRAIGASAGVGTAGLLGSSVASMMNNAGTSNMNANALLGMASTGVGSGVDSRLLAEQNLKGMGALGGMTSGSIDGYQHAVNIQAAMKAGSGNVYLSNAIASMDPTQMANVLGGGKISAQMRARGGSEAMVKKAFGYELNSAAAVMANDPGMANSDQGKALAGIRAHGGDVQAWYKSLKKGEREAGQAGFSAVLSDRFGMKDDAAAGAARVALEGRGFSSKGKKLAGPGGGDSPEARQLGIENDQQKVDLDKLKVAAADLGIAFDVLAAKVKFASDNMGKTNPENETVLNEAIGLYKTNPGKYKSIDEALVQVRKGPPTKARVDEKETSGHYQ